MWVGAVLAVSLVAGALVYVLALKVTGADGPRGPVARRTGSDPGAVPRTVQLSAIPGTTFLPVSVIRTPLRARLLGLLGLLLLIAISGVGPKLALGILSGIGVPELYEAIHRRDLARLQKIPGVGKKTAERVLLELRDKLKIDDAPSPGDELDPSGAGDAASQTEIEAASALINLGYSRAVADRAVAAALRAAGAEASLEDVLKRALAGLVR